MEIRCPGCATRYSIPDDKVRGRRGSFPCHRCKAKVPIDGTVLVSGAKASLPESTPSSARESTLQGMPRASKPASARAQAVAESAHGLSGAETEDAATRLFVAPSPVSRPRLPPPPRPAPPPTADLADAIDEEEATRLVSLIGPGASLAPAAPKEDEATQMVSAATALALAEASSGDDEATRMVSTSPVIPGGGGTGEESTRRLSPDEQAKLNEVLKANAGVPAPPASSRAAASASKAGAEKSQSPARSREATNPPGAAVEKAPKAVVIREETSPSRAAAPAPKAVITAAPKGEVTGHRPRHSSELTGKTRIVRVQRKQSTGGVVRVLLLMLAAGAGGYLLSQLMNARRARPVDSAPARTYREPGPPKAAH